MKITPKSRAELQTDALALHGILQGLELLQNEISVGSEPIHNAIYAITQDATAKAGALSDALDQMNAPKGGEA